MDVIMATMSEKLAAVALEVVPAGLIKWLRGKRFDLIEISEDEAFALGVNAMPLSQDTIVSGAGSVTLNAQLRARGLTVLDPDLSVFAGGGGGAHCLAQALRRERS
jgi:N-dimethylarginine dimethylaminohydrolase